MAKKNKGVVKSRVMKLIKDLETTKTKQTKGMLARRATPKSAFRFCCLGRACEVAKANGCKVEVTTNGSKRDRYYDKEAYVLPKAVKEWYGFSVANPVLAGKDAAVCNDELGMSFPEIAKLFLEELKKGTL